MKKKFLLICFSLLILADISTAIKDLYLLHRNATEIEVIPYTDTFSIYAGITGLFEMPLDNMEEDQHVYVSLQVSGGSVGIRLLDPSGKQVASLMGRKANRIDYRISSSGDYRLSIVASKADFCLSVLKADPNDC